MRDAARIEADRQLQFSQYGRAAVLKLYDREGNELRTIRLYWNRYRKRTREGAVWFLFKVADLKSEFAVDMRKAGDGGTLDVLGARYRVNGVTQWEPGESKIWEVAATASVAPATEFFAQP